MAGRPTVVRPAGSALLLAVLTVLAPLGLLGCGTDDPAGAPASTAYGPLHLPPGEGRHPRAGAAGDVVDCDAWGSGGAFRGEVYMEGATSDTAAGAVRTAYGERVFTVRPRDLAVAAESGDRVLFVGEVDGIVKAAVVVRDGQGAEGTGGDGWYAESWAECDVVELPADLVEEFGYEVWTDAEGRTVPTRRLEVFRGAEHCDWQDMTFLSLGPYGGPGPTFVRDPDPSLRGHFAEPFVARTTLPGDAVDSGFRHGGDRLWLGPDHSRAYVGREPDDVEMWPRMVKLLGCA